MKMYLNLRLVYVSNGPLQLQRDSDSAKASNMESDIQGRISAQRRLEWVQTTTSVETANVGKVFIMRAGLAMLLQKER